MSGHMLPATLQRRSSRSSGSQTACRSARVGKPRSHHNSPRTMERRKTTTETKLYATLDDHYRMMFGTEEPEEVIEERPQPTRPLSWHPSSTQFQTSQPTNYFDPMPQHDWSRQYASSPRHSAHGSDFYSLSTRNSMFDQTSVPQTSAHGHQGSDESDYSWQSVPQQTPSYALSAMNTPTSEPLPWYLQQWAQKNQAELSTDSQNGSSDFLPILHPTEQDEEMEDDGEKLVALGLYDHPEPSLTWGGLEEATGKGLKLEETWQPPEEEEEDDDDADDASSEASVDEPSPPLPQHSQHLQLPVQGKAQTPGSLEGQSFFFDEDETVSKEWWFQQLKQPSSMPVRDTGLGYDWL